MIHSKIGYAGVVGALILSGAFAGCIDNGNDVGFEDGAGGAEGVDNTAFTAVSTTGPGYGGSGEVGNTGYTSVGTTGSDGFTSLVTGVANTTVGTTGAGYGGSGEVGNTGYTGIVTTGSDGSTSLVTGVANTTVGTTGGGYGGSTTVGSTGAGGAPPDGTCGPEELALHCEVTEICRVVDTLGSLQYSCVPNPCYEHNQANSCECAASVCGSEAPNCVMIEDDTVVACVCVLC